MAISDKKVTIIIPAYNVENYIEECLNSVCHQTFDNLQIIVVDDGSTDRTYERIKDISSRDKRILVLQKDNAGVSSARNMALSYAEGEYISFLDADDCMEKDAVSALVNAMETADNDWVSCQYSRWDDKGDRLDDYSFITGERAFATDEDRISFLLRDYLDYHMGYEVWNKLYKAEIIKGNHISFPEEVRIGEDLAFNMKYLMYVGRLSCIADRCVRYRVRSGSAMGEQKEIADNLTESIRLLKNVWEYIVLVGNKVFTGRFPLIYIKRIEHDYIGHNPKEIVESYHRLSDLSFAKKYYSELEEIKEELLDLYPAEIARMKYRYHMYVKAGLCGESALEVMGRLVYNGYRTLRGREPIEKWKMPY